MSAKGQVPEQQADDPPYILPEQIGYLLRLANQRHLEIFHQHMPDLTPTQFSLLITLSTCKEASQNELGRQINIDAATTNGVVERLLKKQLICSSVDPSDKRRLRLSLTESGKRLVSQSIPVARQITVDTLEALTPRESHRLVQLLKKLLP